MIRDDVVQLASSGRLEDAERRLNAGSTLMSESDRLESIGTIRFYRRDLQGAVDAFEMAIKLSPGRVIARYQYLAGLEMERAGDLVNAFKRYQAAIEADKRFVDAYVDLGGLLVKVGDYNGAQKCYEDALLLEPDNEGIKQNLSLVRKRTGSEHPIR